MTESTTGTDRSAGISFSELLAVDSHAVDLYAVDLHVVVDLLRDESPPGSLTASIH